MAFGMETGRDGIFIYRSIILNITITCAVVHISPAVGTSLSRVLYIIGVQIDRLRRQYDQFFYSAA